MIVKQLVGVARAEDAEGVWMLDLIEGKLKRVSGGRSALAAELASEAGQDNLLLAGLAVAAHRRGLVLGPTQVYDFAHPPVLGGAMDVEQVGVSEFVVAVNVAGHIHDQIRRVPPGTKIDKITIDGG